MYLKTVANHGAAEAAALRANTATLPEGLEDTVWAEHAEDFLGATDGPYRLLARLKVGSASVTYKAEDRLLGRKLAIKVAAPDAAEQLLIEARTAARLNHPNSLPVYAVHQEQGAVLVTRPYLERGSALEVLTATGPFPLIAATRVCRLAARGLVAAHSAGIHHGNLSPRNILLGRDEEVMVADFGGEARGNARSPDAYRADVFALAASYYRLLTGKEPSEADLDTSALAASFRTWGPREGSILRAWTALVQRALNPDAAQRFRTVGELADELDRIECLFREAQTCAEIDLSRETTGGPRQSGNGAAPTLPPSGTALGNYVLLEEIGRGSSGHVFRAQHQTLDMPVAIKFLPRNEPGGKAASSRQLRAEAQLLARLNHPNIVRVFDFQSDACHPYLVMEYVEGPSLASLIAEQGRIVPDRALRLLEQVADALSAAARLGIVHRDVKPANILLDGQGRAKLADLGLAVVLGEYLARLSDSPPRTDAVAGTAAYMAPEQGLGSGTIDHRADIYALGATFYHVLTGQLPFSGRSCREVMLKHVKETPVPPHALVPEVDSELSDLVMKMMAKDPGQRFPSYDALQHALRTLTLPPAARPRGCGAHSSGPGPVLTGLGWRPRQTHSGHRGRITSLAFAPRSDLLASGSEDRTVKVWDLAGHAEVATVDGAGGPIKAVAFDADGTTLATADGGPAVRLWDVGRGDFFATLGHDDADALTAVACSPDGRLLAAGTLAGGIRVWDVAAGQLQYVLESHQQAVLGLQFAPDGCTLASAGVDQTVRLWDLETERLRAVLRGHTFGVSSVAFAPDGRLLVSTGWDTLVKVWDAVAGKELATLTGHAASVRAASFNPDGRTVATAGWDRSVKVWDVAAGMCRLTLPGHAREVNAVAYSPTGRWLVSGDDQGDLRVWEQPR